MSQYPSKSPSHDPSTPLDDAPRKRREKRDKSTRDFWRACRFLYPSELC